MALVTGARHFWELKTCYEVMGIERGDFDARTLKKARDKLLPRVHPDKAGKDSSKAVVRAKYDIVMFAYEVLSDDASRIKYDKLLDKRFEDVRLDKLIHRHKGEYIKELREMIAVYTDTPVPPVQLPKPTEQRPVVSVSFNSFVFFSMVSMDVRLR